MAVQQEGDGKQGGADSARGTPRAKSTPGYNLTLREGELGFLQKEPYADTRPKLPNWTRHDEFMRAATRAARPVETATWQLGLRAQTPAFGKSGKRGSAPRRHDKQADRRWHEHFQLPCHSFDMVQDLQTIKERARGQREDDGTPKTGKDGKAEVQTPGRTPRNMVDPHREMLHTTEKYKPKVVSNTQEFRHFREAGNHPDICRYMVSIRS